MTKKRGRGRPKGSKNKAKVPENFIPKDSTENTENTENTAEQVQ